MIVNVWRDRNGLDGPPDDSWLLPQSDPLSQNSCRFVMQAVKRDDPAAVRIELVQGGEVTSLTYSGDTEESEG